MYEACFGLRQRPFASVPRTDQYFPAASIESARQTLTRAVERAAGLGMVVGPSGTGKTLLCRMLAEQFKDRFDVVLLCSGHVSTRRALLQSIQYELGRPYRGMDEGDLRLALVDRLTSDEDCPTGLLLLVDEAHALPYRLFEEIRMITNLVCGGQPRVRLVLAGDPRLEEHLASPKLESFSQRLVARCYLEPMGRVETEQYIEAQVAEAGGPEGGLFTPEACRAVHQATDGVPRQVNQVCDHALLLACADGRQPVDAARIEEAWADLQQLPTPSNSSARSAEGGGVVEFGGLDDELPASSGDEPVAGPESTEGGEPENPHLHLAAGTEDLDTESLGAESLGRLDQIEQALADLEGPFEPAGAIGPEVELVFDETVNPFDEEFQEEETVTERFRAPRVRLPANPADGSSDAPTLPLSSLREERRDDLPTDINRSGSLQRPSAADEVVHTGPPAPKVAREEVAGADPSRETVPLRRDSVEAGVSDDSDMIVIEEGYDDVNSPKASPIIPVRRQEYRQLFARLRRG